jgi:hypothetical protein
MFPLAVGWLGFATAIAMLAFAAPADAVLVYQGQPVNGGDAPIVAAKNDGSEARVIAAGLGPRVSPSGHKVAYASGLSLWVVGNRGRRRHLLTRGAYNTGAFLPFVWSHDDRHLIASTTGDGAWLIDVRDRTKTRMRLNKEYIGASFAPGDSMFAIASFSEVNDGTFTAIRIPSLKRHPLGDGVAPMWGEHGLAFNRAGRLLLLTHLYERPETLLRRGAVPFDWSADGKRLLAYENDSLAHQALLIDLGPRHIKRLKQHIFPAQLSRDGTEVLGETGQSPNEADGDVVVREPKGTLKVLATNATRPSWTK